MKKQRQRNNARMPTHKSRANIYKTNKESLVMSVRFTTVSLSHSISLCLSSTTFWLVCRTDWPFTQGRQQWDDTENMHTQTHTRRQTLWHTDRLLHSHSHSFTHIVCISVDFGAMTRISLQLPAFPVVCPCSCPLCLSLPPATNHCCHCPFAQQLLRDNLCPHSPQTFAFIVCANPCADKSA